MRKKVLLTLGVAVVLVASTGLATLATFTAETTNPSNKVAFGTLMLSNTKQGGTACLSTGGGAITTNFNAACDPLFDLSAMKPGDSGSGNLTLQNVGSFDASALKFYVGACTPGDAAGETYHGTGDPCSTVRVYVQQYSDAAWTTPSACVYGGGTATTCDFSDATKTLDDLATNHGSANPVVIGSGLAAGAKAYFKVAVQLPSGADNS